MSLIPWRRPSGAIERGGRPTHPLDHFRREMDELFDRFFHAPWESPALGLTRPWGPQAELTESDKDVTLRLELPGVQTEDIQIDVSGNVLTVRGEKKEEKEEKRENCLYTERHFGRFSRSVELPASVNLDKANATFKDGVLTITAEKSPEAKAKKIPLRTG
jgi:HSP20 family protein